MSLVKLFVSVMVVFMAMILACDSKPMPSDNDLTDNPIPLDQNIVFEVEYENHAWGFSYHGWFVTDSGEIWSYSYSEDEEPWDTRLNFPLTLELLREKYNHNPVYVGNVDLSILAEKIELIPAYDEFHIYEEAAVCADLGV